MMKKRTAVFLVTLSCFLCGAGRPEASTDPPAHHVMLDPGHGGEKNGGTSFTGVPEKSFNNRLALIVAEQLEAKGYRISWTRSPDVDRFISPAERAKMANQLMPDLFVSIHHDMEFNGNKLRGHTLFYSSYKAGIDHDGLGVEVNGRWYPDFIKEEIVDGHTRIHYLNQSGQQQVARKYWDIFTVKDKTPSTQADNGRKAAKAIADEFSKLQLTPPGPHGALREMDFIVLRRTDMPSVLVEAGHISHPDEERLLEAPQNVDAIANAIVKGISRYFDR